VVTGISIAKTNVTTVSRNKDLVKEIMRYTQLVALSAIGNQPFACSFGSSAILGPSGSHPWLLGGSEDPWFSVPVFRRVWLCR
jgi:hypothetical protein